MIRHGIRRLRRAARSVRSGFERRVLILLYHRVAESRSDPWELCVSPRHFAEHLEVLRQHTRPVRLQQLTQTFTEGNLPERSVVITFDDGYADNLYNAKPMLEHSDIPATFFLSTGYIGHEREFWWDELERLLLQPGTLPKTLHLSANGRSYRWELGEAVDYTEDAFDYYRRWRAWEKAPTSRHALYSSLWELLNPMSEAERQKVLDEILRWAGGESMARPTHRSLSLEEVVALAQGELSEIGAHTVTHPALSALPAASQRGEIRQSKARLEEILCCPVPSFSYPYGNQHHYTAETVSIVREAGFACACSNFAGVVERTTDPSQLPRAAVPDYGGKKFARWLFRRFCD
jgi:peptidoglycan/xylan/chitin deacetylase (PgdA/CDA1 family)